jgi:LytS/YehU family sensor histidine kinase
LYDLLGDEAASGFSVEEYGKLIYGIQQIFSQFCVFALLGLFNFSLKDKVFKTNALNPILNGVFVIFANLLIIFLTALLQALIFKMGYPGKGGIAISFFFWKDFIVYSIAIPLAYVLKMNNNLKETKRDNLKLKTEKAKAELISLREQLSPHFFFNTLNSLSAVIRTAEKSDSLEFVEKLSQVYRYILDSGNNNLVSINEEIGFLNDYSYLLHKRFGNNFIIDNRINSNVFDYKIPSLALQVLLENVTKHNKLLSSNPIKITIENTDDVIFFRNIMIRKANVESHGSGLKNLNKRYQMICGRAIEIIEKNDEFCVKIPIIK